MLLLVREGGPASTVWEELPQTARDGWRHELLDISAECGDLLHSARGDEADLRARHHVDRLDLRRDRPVELVHLELVLEVGDDAKPLDDHLGVPAARELDDELLEDVDLDVRDVGQRVADELDPLVDREARRLVLRRADDADDDTVEDLRGPADHIDVAVRDGVVRAGADGGDKGTNKAKWFAADRLR